MDILEKPELITSIQIPNFEVQDTFGGKTRRRRGRRQRRIQTTSKRYAFHKALVNLVRK